MKKVQSKIKKIEITPEEGYQLLMRESTRKPKRIASKEEAEKIYGKWPPERVKQFNEYTPATIDKMMREQVQRGADKLIGEYMKEWGYVAKSNVDAEVLKVLKQLKAQMGKEYKKFPAGFGKWEDGYADGIRDCMKMIDNKITKLNKTTRK